MLIHRTPPFVKHNWNVEIKVLQYCLKVIRIFSFLTELPFLSLFPFYFISLFIFLAFCETNQQSHDKSDLIVLKDSFFNGMGKIRGRLGFFPPFHFFSPSLLLSLSGGELGRAAVSRTRCCTPAGVLKARLWRWFSVRSLSLRPLGNVLSLKLLTFKKLFPYIFFRLVTLWNSCLSLLKKPTCYHLLYGNITTILYLFSMLCTYEVHDFCHHFVAMIPGLS